jgi:hypothetical protein
MRSAVEGLRIEGRLAPPSIAEYTLSSSEHIVGRSQ